MMSSGVHDDFLLTFFEEKNKNKQTNKQTNNNNNNNKQVKPLRGYHFLREEGPKYTGVMTMKLSIDAQALKLSLTDNFR